jgi:hypothetical protein
VLPGPGAQAQALPGGDELDRGGAVGGEGIEAQLAGVSYLPIEKIANFTFTWLLKESLLFP